MTLRGLRLAVQFLTRVPAGSIPDFTPRDLSRSAHWFPLVGAFVGAVTCAALILGARIDPWFGALLAVCVWIGVTGALHLDGLADLADALGAAHRDRARFLEVLRDPHVGTFGVIALILAVAAKLILLSVAARQHSARDLLASIPLIAASSRYAALVWSAWLPPLASGSAERFAWRKSTPSLIGWAIVLGGASIALSPATLLAAVAIAAWGLWLKRRLGGITGDCLGAGVELVEIATLIAIVVI